MYLLLLLLLISSTLFSQSAGNPGNTSKNWTRISKNKLYPTISEDDVSFEVERIGNNVLFHLYSKHMKNIKAIFIEKSTDPVNGFKRCTDIYLPTYGPDISNYVE